MYLLEALKKWNQIQPSKVLYSYLSDTGEVAKSLTYAELDEQSTLLANALVEQYNCSVGDRILLVYPPSLDFVVAFFACIKAGLVAVPTFPPDPSRLNKDVTMFAVISASCGAKIALTSGVYNFATKVSTLFDAVTRQSASTGIVWPKDLQWIVTDSILAAAGSQVSSPMQLQLQIRDGCNPHDIAFLQYTSGSTSEPKGVIITQDSLRHNLNLIITGLSAVDDTVVVSWLPQYHDMGLIGSFLGAMYCGGSGYYLSPLSFIRNPNVWIQSISKYRGTHMQAPNFAYSLCVRKFLLASRSDASAWTQSIDLSSVRHMINAAEPVEASAIDAFYAVFERYGLRKGVVMPTYGLAEHTVYVCSNGKRRLSVNKLDLEALREVTIYDTIDGEQNSSQPHRKQTRSKGKAVTAGTEGSDGSEGGGSGASGDREDGRIWIVGCGKPAESDGLHLQIVDTETRQPLGDNLVGEVWLRSPSCADGYWGLKEKSLEDFGAVFTSDSRDGRANGEGYLRTGDLGFMNGGELFICGRVKDLVIIRGRNHYPQDIERSCESAAEGAIRLGCSAAFSVPMQGSECLIYVAELNDSLTASAATAAASGTTSTKQQLRSQLSELAVNMNRQIGMVHGVTATVISLVKARTIPKTTSGKIARQWVRKAYLESKLEELYQWNSINDDPAVGQDDYFQDTTAGNSPAPLCPDKDLQNELAKSQVDPTGLPLESVIVDVQRAVAGLINKPPNTLAVDKPLTRLGMDSMRGIELQAALEKLFSIQLPDSLMFEADATITTIAKALVAGGRVRSRPIMVKGWEMVEAARAQITGRNAGKSAPSGALPAQWFREHAVKADVDTLRFPDGCARELAPLSQFQDVRYIAVSLWLFGMFMAMPIVAIAAFALFPAKYVVGGIAIWLIGIYGFPAERWPPEFRRTTLLETALRYFSARLIIEQPINTAIPAVYAMGPHGVFCIGPSIQTLLNEFALGTNFHHLAANATFWVPMYNITLKMMGYKSVDRDTFKGLLESGRSVGVVPGGIAEMFTAGREDRDEVMVVLQRKGFVRIALETGAQIVPSYCFGNTQTFTSVTGSKMEALSRALRMSLIWFWGRFYLPVPYRTPLLTVIGRPIQCPKIVDPSPEIVNEYHNLYLRETKRLFNSYRNTYNWQDKSLVFSS